MHKVNMTSNQNQSQSQSQSQRQECGYLEIIIGPMFSGKTSKLLEIYKQCKFCNIQVIVINYAEDIRYNETLLSTHDKIMIPCIQAMNLSDIEYQGSDVILINEAQFFQDLKPLVEDMLKNNKKVYLSGLDGDFKREKFGSLIDLIPLCDKVTKLNSLCGICKDGTPGIFSLRLTNEEEQKLIGSNNYIPVCRKCYN